MRAAVASGADRVSLVLPWSELLVLRRPAAAFGSLVLRARGRAESLVGRARPQVVAGVRAGADALVALAAWARVAGRRLRGRLPRLVPVVARLRRSFARAIGSPRAEPGP